jgi:hypothetical protein
MVLQFTQTVIILVRDVLFELSLALIGGITLWIFSKIFKLSDQSLKTAFKVTLIIAIAQFVLLSLPFIVQNTQLAIIVRMLSLLFVILAIWLINVNYKIGLVKALIIGLIWYFLIYYIVRLFLGLFVLAAFAKP